MARVASFASDFKLHRLSMAVRVAGITMQEPDHKVLWTVSKTRMRLPPRTLWRSAAE